MTDDPLQQAARTLGLVIARDTDRAIRGALLDRGVAMIDALPRMSQRIQGGRTVVLLDGEPLVEIWPVKTTWSDDGLRVTSSVDVGVVTPTKRVPVCVVCGAWGSAVLGRGDGKWRCQNAECT